MKRVSLAAILATSALATGASPQEAKAQDGTNSQSVLTARISERLEVETNRGLDDPSDGDSYLSQTRFGLDYDRRTPTQSLRLGLDTSLRGLKEEDEDLDWRVADPTTLSFAYDQEGPSTRFDANFGLRVTRTDYEYDILDFDEPDLTDTVEGDAYEYRYTAGLGFVLGTDSPSLYEFRLAGTATTFSEDVDDNTDLNERVSAEASAAWILRITPIWASVLSASHQVSEIENLADERLTVTDVTAGAVLTPNTELEMRMAVGYTQRERERFGEVVEDDNGIVVTNQFIYRLPSTTLSGNARWSNATEDSRLSLDLRANYQMLRGRLNGRVFNRYRTAGNGEERSIRGLSVGWRRDLNEVSRVALSMGLTHEENLDNDADPDITRSNLTASYSHDITRSVAATLGYTYRTREDGPIDADSHRVFFEIGKTFEVGI